MDKDEIKVSAKGVAGALFGVALATYVWKMHSGEKPLSKLLTRLSNVVEQLENIELDEENDIKEQIKKILTIIATNNDSTKK